METTFYYYDPAHSLSPFAYALPGELGEGCALPDHALLSAPEQRPGFWPVLNAAGNGWGYVEDHRQQKDERDRIIEGTGTPYWLTAAGDDWRSEPRYMKELGPLPKGALLRRPEKSQSEIDAERKREILATMADIDTKAARPLRAMVAGTATDDDRTAVAELEARAQMLRIELAALGGK